MTRREQLMCLESPSSTPHRGTMTSEASCRRSERHAGSAAAGSVQQSAKDQLGLFPTHGPEIYLLLGWVG